MNFPMVFARMVFVSIMVGLAGFDYWLYGFMRTQDNGGHWWGLYIMVNLFIAPFFLSAITLFAETLFKTKLLVRRGSLSHKFLYGMAVEMATDAETEKKDTLDIRICSLFMSRGHPFSYSVLPVS